MLDQSVVCSIKHFNVRVVKIGGKFGRNHALTNKHDQPMIEFYLQPQPACPTKQPGHFLSRYFYSTLVERDPTVGLLIDTSMDDLSLSAQEMEIVMARIKEKFSAKG